MSASKPDVEGAKSAENQNKGHEEPNRWWHLLKNEPDRVIELIFAACVVIFAYLGWQNSKSSSYQTDQLIRAAGISAYAAQQNLQAARDFSTSARNINNGINDAVDRLGDQAKAIEATRKSSANQADRSFKVTLDNFHQDQRAWMGTCSYQMNSFENGKPIEFEITFCNSGKTPASHVFARITYKVSPFAVDGPSPEDLIQAVFRPSISAAPQGTIEISTGRNRGLAFPGIDNLAHTRLDSAFQAIKSGSMILYYYGDLQYLDLSGKTRDTEFCVFLAYPQTKELERCKEHNEIY